MNQRISIRSGDIPEIPAQDFSSLRLLSGEADLLQALRSINARDTEGRSYNCANCALAVEMVLRGYDVRARPVPDGSNVGNIDQYIINGKLLHVPYVMSDKLKHTYRIADNYRHRYWSMVRKHGYADKNWRVNKKLRVSLENYFDELDSERSSLYNEVIDSILENPSIFGSRGIMVLGIMGDINPTESPRIYHAINYAINQESREVVFCDAQNLKHLRDNDPFRHVNPCEAYIMRTDDKEISPRITQCVYSDTQE